jgi:hypothetical protein
MDEIKNLLSDIRGPYFADYSKQTVFDPKVHKRYNAKHYYQVGAEFFVRRCPCAHGLILLTGEVEGADQGCRSIGFKQESI